MHFSVYDVLLVIGYWVLGIGHWERREQGTEFLTFDLILPSPQSPPKNN
jgi:hypothetical protein